MKIVINDDFGGYGLGVAKEFENFVRKYTYDRTNPDIVKFVEDNPNNSGDLVVVEIPDIATDWDMNERDGWESIIYVVDGKIHYA